VGLLVSSCGQLQPPKEKARPFRFEKLDLTRSDENGRPLWRLVSPLTRYQLEERRSSLSDPVATIYKDGKPKYTITAPKGLVIDDGRRVELYEGVTFRVLDDRQIVVRAERVFWQRDYEVVNFEGQPTLLDLTRRVVAGQARFHTNTDTLFAWKGIKLKSWNGRRDETETPALEVETQQVNWNTSSGAINMDFPIKGIQRPSPKQTRRLSSPSLVGNTLKEWYDFSSPVLITEPEEALIIRAGRSRWWAAQERITSAEPAQGSLKELNVSGRALEIQQKQSLLTIKQDCRLLQPDQDLSAQRCSWNWDSGAVLAEGDVVLRRDELQQVTRASRLEGVTGDDGRIKFSAPGQRVETQLQIQEKSPDPSAPSPAAAPVQF
jgi:hypothetical protein